MAEQPPPHPTLNNGYYEFFGRHRRELVHEIRMKTPDAHGEELARLVLTHIDPVLGQKASADAGFFSGWVREHEGELPREEALGDYIAEREAGGRTEKDDTMERGDLRWVGLAVLVAAVASGAVLLARRAQSQAPVPQPEVPRQLRIAMAVFARKIREAGSEPTAAAQLLTHAAYWWVGHGDAWDQVARLGGLSAVDRLPESDDALLVVVFEGASGDTTSLPSSRPEGASRLRGAASVGDLRWVGTYAVRDPRQLVPSGFQR